MLDNALPSSCDINLPSNAGNSINSLCTLGPCVGPAGTGPDGGRRGGGCLVGGDTGEEVALLKPQRPLNLTHLLLGGS